MVELLRPIRGGFLRPFGCGWFIREFLSGNRPYSSPVIDPSTGSPQADIFYNYKNALRLAQAYDKATKIEEKRAKRENRAIEPDYIESIAQQYLTQIPYKTFSCRYHSFVVYFSTIHRLGWVEPSGYEESSSFQDHYPSGNPRRYFRITNLGYAAGDRAWANPRKTLYG